MLIRSCTEGTKKILPPPSQTQEKIQAPPLGPYKNFAPLRPHQKFWPPLQTDGPLPVKNDSSLSIVYGKTIQSLGLQGVISWNKKICLLSCIKIHKNAFAYKHMMSIGGYFHFRYFENVQYFYCKPANIYLFLHIKDDQVSC